MKILSIEELKSCGITPDIKEYIILPPETGDNGNQSPMNDSDVPLSMVPTTSGNGELVYAIYIQ